MVISIQGSCWLSCLKLDSMTLYCCFEVDQRLLVWLTPKFDTSFHTWPNVPKCLKKPSSPEKTCPLGASVKNTLKEGVHVSTVSRVVPVKLDWTLPCQQVAEIPTSPGFFLLVPQQAFKINELLFLHPMLVWAHNSAEDNKCLRWDPPTQPIDSNWRHGREPAGQLARCDPLIYLSLTRCQVLDFLFCALLCSFSLVCVCLSIVMSSLGFFFTSYQFLHVTLPLSLFSFDISKHIGYLLFGTNKGHRSEDMTLTHGPISLPSDT